jgi:hypothetical protein
MSTLAHEGTDIDTTCLKRLKADHTSSIAWLSLHLRPVPHPAGFEMDLTPHKAILTHKCYTIFLSAYEFPVSFVNERFIDPVFDAQVSGLLIRCDIMIRYTV